VVTAKPSSKSEQSAQRWLRESFRKRCNGVIAHPTDGGGDNILEFFSRKNEEILLPKAKRIAGFEIEPAQAVLIKEQL
jgi:hypothetical protein